MVTRRVAGEPFQHIIGKASFYGRDFIINQNVFIPRPETEIIIDQLKLNGKLHSLLDIGTGTGCIAITVRLENLSNYVFATDISDNAISSALENVKLHRVQNIKISHHNFIQQGFKFSLYPMCT